MPSSPSTLLMQLDRQLCFALYSTSLSMTKVYKPLLQALDLTYPQYLVLLALWESEPLTVSTLGDRLFLDSGTLTPLLKRMEHAGLLLRQRSADDERRVDIRLTPAGKKLKTRAAAIPACLTAAADCPLSELQALTRQLQALRSRLIAVAEAAD